MAMLCVMTSNILGTEVKNQKTTLLQIVETLKLQIWEAATQVMNTLRRLKAHTQGVDMESTGALSQGENKNPWEAVVQNAGRLDREKNEASKAPVQKNLEALD